MAVLLTNTLRQSASAGMVVSSGGVAAVGGPGTSIPIGTILHESFTDGAHLLLIGSMVIGFLSGEAGKAMMQPFSGDLFKGMLAFFPLNILVGIPLYTALALAVLG